mmetsp:Transcript_67681/g.159338  ORF Transcript_67681/g.159338 Transcript_67681/m.159338 type:complete len:107 (+) Transcript_67681:713-1033(+)
MSNVVEATVRARRRPKSAPEGAGTVQDTWHSAPALSNVGAAGFSVRLLCQWTVYTRGGKETGAAYPSCYCVCDAINCSHHPEFFSPGFSMKMAKPFFQPVQDDSAT